MNAAEPNPQVVPDARCEESSLDALLDECELSPFEPDYTGPCVIGACVEDRHPSLLGRVRVRWREVDGVARDSWVPTLQALPVRAADRVLMLRPDNGREPIVIGVVDGFARRPTSEPHPAARIELRRDESVEIVGSDGRPLLVVREGESGPVIELRHDDLELATPGRLRLRAREVEIAAEQGQVAIAATDDVVVRGEVIRLN